MRKLMMVLIALFIVLLVDQWTKEIDAPIYATSSFKLPFSMERINNTLDDAGNGSGIYSTLSQVQVVESLLWKDDTFCFEESYCVICMSIIPVIPNRLFS